MVERIMLQRSFLKKFEGSVSPAADQRSIADFLARNEGCRTWKFEATDTLSALVDEEFRGFLYRLVYPSFDSSFGLADISAGFAVGPGANVGCEEDDFLTKLFHSPLTSTHQALSVLYAHAIRGSTWAAAEQTRAEHYGQRLERGSRLTTVPKTVDETRVIAVEPTLNMVFQKGIGAWLEDRLRMVFGIDIRRNVPQKETQPEINRRLARLGSMENSGEFCTIDLKGASDSLALSLCEQYLPPVLVYWLKLARSPEIRLPDGSWRSLYMVGSMGNAFTFPLQTAVFASIVAACYRTLGINTPRCDGKNPTFGVFGDDIIVLKSAYSAVVAALNRYGFTVNDQKSFSSGYFRESCGGDFWHGHLVRGVYVKRLDSQADVYSVVNRLVRWCVRSGHRLEFTLTYLLSKVRSKLLTVPFTEGDTGGLKVPSSLWINECYVAATRSPYYRALQVKARSYSVPADARSWSVEGGHLRVYNGDAILVALVGGHLRTEKCKGGVDGRIGLRTNGPKRFVVRWRTVPCWDYVPPAEALLLRGADWVIGAGKLLTELLGLEE